MARAIDAQITDFDVLHINGVYLLAGPATGHRGRTTSGAGHHPPHGMLVPEMIAGKSALVKRAWIALKERPRLAKASAIHVTSEEERDGVRRLGLNLAPVVVIGNGVDAPEELPSRAEIERIWSGVAPGQPVSRSRAHRLDERS